jgi:DNA (cytosine-5)-methyltransferase 1
MRYLSVCSGIEAATVAWHELGWEPVAFCEIDKFPSQLLKFYFPWVTNLGNMTKLNRNEYYKNTTFDLLVGGTPCQSFSIAGLRKGLDSANGNLALWFCRILLDKQPPWFVWENVPGVFSSFSGRKGSKAHPRKVRNRRWKEAHITETSDFAAILNAFRECGYSVAYRVLDSQYFGVPQRRRRVFVVGYLGNDWRPPAAVLFESESLRRDCTPSRKKGEEVAGTLDARTRGGGFPGSDGAMSGHVVATLDANYGKLQGASGQDLNHGHSNLIVQPTLYSIMPQNSGKDYKAREVQVTQPIMAGGPVGGNQGGDYVITAGFMAGQGAKSGGIGYQEDTSPTLKASSSGTNTVPAVFAQNTRDEVRYIGGDGQTVGALAAQSGMKQQNYVHSSSIRRLTPLECERLQGFPDNYTNIPGASDSARYKAVGNSMTTHVMRWIGERIQMVEKVIKSLK